MIRLVLSLLCFCGLLVANETMPYSFTLLPRGATPGAVKGSSVALVSSNALFVSLRGGIGQGELKRSNEAWPKTVQVSLQVSGLEQLVLQAGEQRLACFVQSHGSNAVHASLNDKKLTPEDAAWPKLQLIPKEGTPAKIPLDGIIRFTIPAALLREEKIQIYWVDFFR